MGAFGSGCAGRAVGTVNILSLGSVMGGGGKIWEGRDVLQQC